MNDYLIILVVGTFFELAILIGILVMVFSFRSWALKRDEYYSNKLLEYEQRMHDMEIKYLKDLGSMIQENRDLLSQVLEQKK